MALRTEEEYKEGLKDGRKVYMLGNSVEDVTEDPYIKVGVETAAFDFKMGHDPEMKALAVMKDRETGEEISSYFDIPDRPEAVKERFNLVNTACSYAGGAIPFVKDVGTDLLNALLALSGMLDDKTYRDRIISYRDYCARKDLSMAGAVTDTKGDRSKSPSEQESPDYYLRIVDESDDEIVVSGTKAHITASAYCDEVIVIPTRNLTENEKEYAVAFAIPLNTPGILQVCRPNFRYENKYLFPRPEPHKAHVESLLVFDNVRIPKERVFMNGEWQFAQALAYAFTAFHRFTAVSYKIPIIERMAGMGMLIADANGIEKASHVKEIFVNMIKYVETTKALAQAAIAKPENFFNTGYYVADRLTANIAKLYFASNFHEYVRNIQDLCGGLLVTQPTYQDWQNPELRPYLEKSLGGANGYTAEERLKLMSYAHHIIASDFHGYHETLTIHAEGSFAAQKMMMGLEASIDMYKDLARKSIGSNVK